jgi:hypothetical protein
MSNRDDSKRVKFGMEKLENAPKRRKVFDSLLKGLTNQQIVEELGGKSKGTVSKTVSTIYEIFGLSKEDSKNPRKELIALITKHRPDLVPHLHKLYPPSDFVPLNSPLYVTRCEDKDFEDALLSKYHNFFQIKGTKGIGKSSLLLRGKQLLEETMEHQVLFIDLASQIFTETELTDLDSFLCQFSYVIEKEFDRKIKKGSKTDLEARRTEIVNYWETEKKKPIPLKPSTGEICTEYLKTHIFSKIRQPKTLLIDSIDIAFGKPIHEDFLGLLRHWDKQIKNEKENTKDNEEAIWPNIIIAYSTGDYAKYGIENSTLANVGENFVLKEFTKEEVIHLASKYGISLPESKALQLMDLVGGHPELIQKSLYELHKNNLSMDDLVSKSTDIDGPFKDYLMPHLIMLRDHPKLASYFMRILIKGKEEEFTDVISLRQLEKSGLIKTQGLHAVPTCDLYKKYYQNHLRDYVNPL